MLVALPGGSDPALEDLAKHMPVALRLVLRTVAQEGDRCTLPEFLQQAEGELLAVVLDRPVPLVDRAALEQLLAVTPPEPGPVDGPRLNLPQPIATIRSRAPRAAAAMPASTSISAATPSPASASRTFTIVVFCMFGQTIRGAMW